MTDELSDAQMELARRRGWRLVYRMHAAGNEWSLLLTDPAPATTVPVDLSGPVLEVVDALEPDWEGTWAELVAAAKELVEGRGELLSPSARRRIDGPYQTEKSDSRRAASSGPGVGSGAPRVRL